VPPGHQGKSGATVDLIHLALWILAAALAAGFRYQPDNMWPGRSWTIIFYRSNFVK